MYSYRGLALKKMSRVEKRKTRSENPYTDVFFNEDCISGAAERLPDASVDLIITDPPYGIEGGSLHKHYNRDESQVLDGYVDVAPEDYRTFTSNWIKQAARVLKPGAMLIVVSGYSQLLSVLDALEAPANNLAYHRHIIWKYNFGVWTTKKYVSSHYHIVCYTKKTIDGSPQPQPTATTNDVADSVWVLNREYKPGEVRNKNQLPSTLLSRLLDIGNVKAGDLVADFFLGSFSTARAAIARGMHATGFEVNTDAFNHWSEVTKEALAERDHASKKALRQQSLTFASKNTKKAPIVVASTAIAVPPVAALPGSVAVVICWPRDVPTREWLANVYEALQPGGSLYIVFSPEQLREGLTLLHGQVGLKEINHIVWRHTFSKSTVYVSAHNHVLFLEKQSPDAERTFKTHAFFKQDTRRSDTRSANYVDREDVWWNSPANGDPDSPMTWKDVVRKAIKYSSADGETVADFTNDNVVDGVVRDLKRVYVK